MAFTPRGKEEIRFETERNKSEFIRQCVVELLSESFSGTKEIPCQYDVDKAINISKYIYENIYNV